MLRESVVLSTRFLDDVVTANAYVPAVPQLREAAYRARRIGLGIMGLADLMYHVGVRYGSAEGQEFAAQVMEFVRFHCMQTSVQLAERARAVPGHQRQPLRSAGSALDAADAARRPTTRDFGRPTIDWDEIVDGIRQPRHPQRRPDHRRPHRHHRHRRRLRRLRLRAGLCAGLLSATSTTAARTCS